MQVTMDTVDIIKLAGLFFGSTGVFILYVKYRVLSKTGPLNGAVASIVRIEAALAKAEERWQGDHDILVRVDDAVGRHEIVIESLRKHRHDHRDVLTTLEGQVKALEKNLEAS